MATKVRDDGRHIDENQENLSVEGNVFDNDSNATEEHVQVGTLTNDGVGAYGKLTLDREGNYTYVVTKPKEIDKLTEGVDVTETFTYTLEYVNQAGHHKEKEMTIEIKIHGENDQPLILDVVKGVYEPVRDHVYHAGTPGEEHREQPLTGVQTLIEDQLKMQDIDPNTPGVQVDVDSVNTPDTHTFNIDQGSITVTTDVPLTDKQLKLVKDNVTVTLVDAATGEYKVDGNFDFLSVGDNATVTFKYNVIDSNTNDEGDAVSTPSDYKTVTLNIAGTNDYFQIGKDQIRDYHDLIDGDIYKSILANDKHPITLTDGTTDVRADINDTISIGDAGIADIDFMNAGGKICVDNAAATLKYVPGDGKAIGKHDFKFYYTATDGYSANWRPNAPEIKAGFVNVNMENLDGDEIDFYQFGDSCCDTLTGSDKGDMLSGMAGNDTLNGGNGGDILYGGAGQDALNGGWGNDILIGGKDNDSMFDSKGNDKYVFAKGDGVDTVEDLNLEVYTDAFGHETHNWDFWDNYDEVHFDKSVKVDAAHKDIAIFMNGDNLEISYSDSDMVTVINQNESPVVPGGPSHNGIEAITVDVDGAPEVSIDKQDINDLLQMIATYDIDDTQAGIQTAQSIDDVRGNTHLMTEINAAFA
jgi:VCBS repeat-containing protein